MYTCSYSIYNINTNILYYYVYIYLYNVVLICRVIPAIDSGCGVFFLHLFGWRLAIHLGFGGPCGVYPIHKPATYNVPKAAKHVNSKYNKYIYIYIHIIYMYIMYTCRVPNCFFWGGWRWPSILWVKMYICHGWTFTASHLPDFLAKNVV